MSSTPRMRSSFPTTPMSGNRGSPGGAVPGTNFGSPRLPDVSKLAPDLSRKPDDNGPRIPFDTIDAPAQRAYVVGLYAVLWFWRLYDYYTLTLGESEPFWLWLKWVAIDGVFLFSLPGFKIPWLDWSLGTILALFFAHVVLDSIMMFRVNVRPVLGFMNYQADNIYRYLGLHHSSRLPSLPTTLGKSLQSQNTTSSRLTS